MESPTVLLTKGWENVKKHFSLFASIYAVPAVVTVVFTFLYGNDPNIATIEPSQMGLFFLFVVIIMVMNLMAAIAMVRAVSQPNDATLQTAYAYARKMFWPYLWVSALVGAAVSVGFILLIIPGIIFMVWFAFSYMVVLLEDIRGADALKKSKSYVTGRWWGVFGRMLFLVLIAILLSAAFSIVANMVSGGNEKMISIIALLANFIIVPLAVSYMYFMYLDVKRLANGTTEAHDEPQSSTEDGAAHGTEEAPQAESTDTKAQIDRKEEGGGGDAPSTKENKQQGY